MAARCWSLLASLLLLVSLLAHSVTGAINLKQIQVATQNTDTQWTIEGVATYEHGSGVIRHFLFRCTSTINNGGGLTWSRKTGGDLTKTQTIATGGIDLDFGSNPSASDAGVYVCQDSNSNDIAELNITNKNPAACPAHNGDLHAVIGETVNIEFYASGLPRTQAGNYTWWHNNVFITNDTFQKDRRQLVIHNAQESDSGEYRFRVLLKFGAFLQLGALATTQLIVAAAPQIALELPAITTATEWGSVTLTCTINSAFPLNIKWGRVGGNLPINQQSFNDAGVATLTIPQVRFSNMGEYYFNASYTSQISGVVHYATCRTQLNIIPVVRLRMDSALIEEFLFQPVGLSFTITCQGSGDLWWTNPAGDNVSNSSSLQFSSFSANENGMYSCRSSLGASETILITNSNPAVYAPVTNVRVALNTNKTLRVHTGGDDPTPSPADIQWYKDSTEITSGTKYTLSKDRTQLTISVTGSEVAGIYEIRVMTTQGGSNASINVSFPDPPVVLVEPSSQTVVEGGNTSFQCSANGTMIHNIQWMFGQSSTLPEGVTVTNTSTLVISAASRDHAGEYSCVVMDEINTVTETVMLLVKYAPTARVGYTPATSQPNVSISYDESKTPRTFSCFGEGYPSPSLVWQFNGGPLPDGLVSIPVTTTNLQLQWRRDLRYSDSGQYQCVAENELNTSVAILNVIVTAQVSISTIYPNSNLLVDTHSPSLTFLLPRNSTGSSSLTCVSRGLPSPKVEWRTPNGTKLSASFLTHSGGVVSAILTWNGNQPASVVECVTFDETVMDKQSIRITTIDSVIRAPEQTIPPIDNRRVEFVIRVLNYTHCEDISSMTLLQQAVEQILSRVVISRCPECQNATDSITIDSGTCSLMTSGATVLKGHIETPDASLTNLIYRSLEEWRQTGPVVFINGSWALLDQTCLLQAPLNSRDECDYTTPPTMLPANDFFNSITFYVVVGAAGFVVIVVTFTALLVVICCAVNRRKHHAVANLTYSPAKSSKRCSSDGGMYSPTTVSSITPMIENEEYIMNNILQSTLQRRNQNHESKHSFTETDELFLRRSPSEQRVLSTTPTEGIDSPSPTGGLAHTFHTSITTQRLQSSGAVVGASVNSINSLPANEILYDPMPGEPKVEAVDHTYDQVHAARAYPPRHNSQGSKVSLRSHNHRIHSPPLEIPAYATTPMCSVMNEPEPYQTPGLSESPQFPLRGSSTGLSSTLPRHYPQPYQQPAPQSRKTSLATLNSLTSTVNRMPRGPISASVGSIKPVGSHVTTVEDDRMTVAGSDAPSSQAWYNNFADSDTGVPTGSTTRHEITPYASIRNSQIQPNPYQQPVWTGASQFSIRSSSPSTHIETIHV